ncbi:hypothetical protein ACE38W_17425 [Chitinophaga sp. Hz27]|uniref:hypothetical protein n=1 Tax=Chitinophaga sp. Hz27 TaxID=3347169 RepID=UPI0035DFCB42
MKSFLLLISIVLLSVAVKAQTTAEWFQQKKTQREYLAKQVALLQQYLGYLKKGYNISKTGLNTISKIKDGDFTLHDVFFKSLGLVNSSIIHYSKTGLLLSSISRIDKVCAQVMVRVGAEDWYNAEDVAYINTVMQNIQRENEGSLSQFMAVAVPGKLQLTDDQRLSRLDGIYADVSDRDEFVNTFLQELLVLKRQRINEKSDANMVRQIYGLK